MSVSVLVDLVQDKLLLCAGLPNSLIKVFFISIHRFSIFVQACLQLLFVGSLSVTSVAAFLFNYEGLLVGHIFISNLLQRDFMIKFFGGARTLPLFLDDSGLSISLAEDVVVASIVVKADISWQVGSLLLHVFIER